MHSGLSLLKSITTGRHLGVRLYLRPFRDGEECRSQSRLVARWEACDAQLAAPLERLDPMTASLPLISLRRGAVVQLGNPAASGDPQRACHGQPS